MLFSSIPFLYYFLPAILICYFAAPKIAKNVVLFLFSLIFYAWGEPSYVFLIIAYILVGYVAGLCIEKSNSTARKIVLTIAILISLPGLIYFKYANFLISNINKAMGFSIPSLSLVLPIGISFYTFQIIGYLVDVYRGDVAAQRKLINFAAYVTLFSQLVAGPIVRYSEIEKSLNIRENNLSMMFYGVERFVIGLAKKIMIANVLGEFVESFRQATEPSIVFYWLYALSYSIHLYFDFSGYSDMAIGLGRILGFQFSENFNYPFIANSVTDFWRRWHISLGSWFRDYVYIPLGGNRVIKIKWFRNILIVWFLTGLWHGANWNFIFWGLFFAVLLGIEKAGLFDLLQKHRVIARIYMIFVILVSFTLFNATGDGQIVCDFSGLIGLNDMPIWSDETKYYLSSYAFIIMIGIVGATPLPKFIVEKIKEIPYIKQIWPTLEVLFCIGTLLVCTAFLVDGSFNPFLYFRF